MSNTPIHGISGAAFRNRVQSLRYISGYGAILNCVARAFRSVYMPHVGAKQAAKLAKRQPAEV